MLGMCELKDFFIMSNFFYTTKECKNFTNNKKTSSHMTNIQLFLQFKSLIILQITIKNLI